MALMEARLDHRTAWTLVGLTAFALGLRLWGLTQQPLWYDEIHVLERAASASPLGVLARLTTDNQAPLYDLLAWVWTRLLGTGPAAVRWPTAVFGALTVPVTAALAQALSGRRWVALVAATWMAASPYLVRYGQEARPYALAALLSALTLLAAVRLLQTGGRRGAWLLGCAAPLLVLTHYYGVLLVAVVALALCLAMPRLAAGWGRVAAAGLGIMLTGLAWAPVAAYQAGTIQMNAIYGGMDPLAALDAQGLHAVTAFTSPSAGAEPTVWVGRLTLLLLLAAGVAVARSAVSPSRERSHTHRSARGVALAALVLAAGVAGVGLLVPQALWERAASAVFKDGRGLDESNLTFVSQAQSLAAAAAAVLVAYAVVIVLRPRLLRSRLVGGPGPSGLVLLVIVGVPALVLLLDRFGTATFAPRNVIVLAPAVAALACTGLAVGPLAWRVVMALALAACAVGDARAAPDFLVRPAWPAVLSQVEAWETDEALVLVHPPWIGRCVEYHGRRAWRSVAGTYRPDEAARLARAHDPVILVAGYEQLRAAASIREALGRTHEHGESVRLGRVQCELWVRAGNR